MRISAISDVHIKKNGDEAYHFLLKFLKHPMTKDSQYVFLLGDIFDLMCGNHIEYFFEFEEIFDELDALAIEGKELHYFEGNHDLHLHKLFSRRFKHGQLKVHTSSYVLELDNHKYYFSHGDEHEVNNIPYHRYKKIITSKPLKFVADYLMPYFFLKTIGEKASEKSRKQGSYFFNEELTRAEFREGVQITTQGKYHFVLGGHSHVKDEFRFGDKSTYLNNGYALKSKSFISIKDHQVEFIPLV